MRPVRREEILDIPTYERSRGEIRTGVIAAKERRRVHVGGVLTFLFENTATIRYQIQEMIRTERITREAEIQHEIETYNEVLGGKGELGVTLLIEIAEPAERDLKLRAWLDLPKHLYLELPGGERVRARYDARQVGDDRLSSVQYLKFDVRGQVPVAVGSDLPALTVRTELGADQQAALAQDLRADAGPDPPRRPRGNVNAGRRGGLPRPGPGISNQTRRRASPRCPEDPPMRHAPRIPRAQVIALSRPDPALLRWQEWGTAVLAVALLVLALLSR
jgi:hypothetical protein